MWIIRTICVLAVCLVVCGTEPFAQENPASAQKTEQRLPPGWQRGVGYVGSKGYEKVMSQVRAATNSGASPRSKTIGLSDEEIGLQGPAQQSPTPMFDDLPPYEGPSWRFEALSLMRNAESAFVIGVALVVSFFVILQLVFVFRSANGLSQIALSQRIRRALILSLNGAFGPEQIKRQQLIVTAGVAFVTAWLAVRGTLDPKTSDAAQRLANLGAHPLASYAGSLLPSLILAPFIYWMSGWTLRRAVARFDQPAVIEIPQRSEAISANEGVVDTPVAATGKDQVKSFSETLKMAGMILIAVGVAASILALFVIWVWGVIWSSDKIFWYAVNASELVLLVCLFVFLPLSLFRRSRKIACFGILASSVLFGATAWMLGVLVTYHYWGGVGVLIGFGLLGIGVVPTGMVAALFQVDWTSFIILGAGLIFTYVTRFLAFWLAGRIDQQNVSLGEA